MLLTLSMGCRVVCFENLFTFRIAACANAPLSNPSLANSLRGGFQPRPARVETDERLSMIEGLVADALLSL